MDVRIKDVTRINQRVLSESTDPDFEFKYIDIGSVDSRGNIAEPETLTRFASAPSRARRLATAGSTVVSTVRTYLRAIARVPTSETPMVFSTGFAVLEPSGDVESRYLSYYCQSEEFVGEVVARSTGVSYPAINPSEIGLMRMSFPPLRQQRRIADFLDTEVNRIDRLAQSRDHQLRLIEERYLTALSEIVTPGISTRGPRNPLYPWLPVGLRTVRLGHFGRVRVGVTVDDSRVLTPDSVEVPYLRVANVQGGRVDLSEVKTIVLPASVARRITLRRGDVLLAEANGNPDNLGRGAVWDGSVDNMVHQNHVFAIALCDYLPEFLIAVLASIHGRRYFRFTSSQVGIATTSTSKVHSMPVPAVKVSEQSSAVAAISSLRKNADALTSRLMTQGALLAERRQALITAAVTGQMDVTTARRVDVA